MGGVEGGDVIAKESVARVLEYIQNIRHQLMMLELEMGILVKNGQKNDTIQTGPHYSKDTEIGAYYEKDRVDG